MSATLSGSRCNISQVKHIMLALASLLSMVMLLLCVSKSHSDSLRNEATRLGYKGTELYDSAHYDQAVEIWQEALEIYKEMEDTEREQASCYESIIGPLLSAQRFQEGILNARKAIALLKKMGDTRGQAQCHTKIGIALEELGSYQEAIANHAEAMDLYAKIGGFERRRARCYELIAGVLSKIGKYEDALLNYRNALELYEMVREDDIFETNILTKFDLSSIPPQSMIYSATFHLYYYRHGDNDPAGRHVRLYRITNDWGEETVTYSTQPPTAHRRTACSSIPSRFGWMTWDVTPDVQDFVDGETDNYGWKIMDDDYWGSVNIPSVQFYARKNIDSMPYLKIEFPSNEGRWSIFPMSTEILRPTDIAQLSQDYPDRTGRAGLTMMLRNKYGAPEKKVQMGRCYGGIGRTLEELGKYEEAIANHKRALALFQQVRGSDRDRAGVYTTVGVIFGNLGKYEECTANQRNALELYEKTRDAKRSHAACYLRIGASLRHLASFEERMTNFEEALALYENIEGTGRERARCYYNIALTFEDFGRWKECIVNYEKALDIYDETEGTNWQQAVCYCSNGSALFQLGRYEESITNHEKALELFKQIEGRERDQVMCHRNLAKVRLSQSHQSALEKAGAHFAEALLLAEKCRDKALGMEARMGLFEKVASVYPEAVLFLIWCSEIDCYPANSIFDEWKSSSDPSTAALQVALHFAEAGKARALLDLISEATLQVKDSLSAKLLEQDEALRNEIGALHTQLMTLDEVDERRLSIETRIEEKRLERNQVEYQLKSTLIGKYRTPEFRKAYEMQKELQEDAAVLEYAVGENETALLVLTKSEIGGWRIPVKRDLPGTLQEHTSEREKKIAGMFEEDPGSVGLVGLVSLYRNWMENLTYEKREKRIRKKTHIQVGTYLWNLLLPEEAREMLRKNGIKKLTIVPDHVLHLLPFGALISDSKTAEEPGNYSECRFLLKDYLIGYSPSLALLDVITKHRAERRSSSRVRKGVLAVGDPVFGTQDERLGREDRPHEDVEPEDISHLSEYYTRTRGDFERLKGTEEEARKVAQCFPPMSIFRDPQPKDTLLAGNSTVLLGFAATPAALEMFHPADYQYVHFATHSLIDEDNPWLSCIVLSGKQTDEEYCPDFLRAMDIFGLELDADVITLSACETGLGKQISGEGMVGLTTPFFYAGASSVVVSLWPVSSRQTVQLMENFYKHLGRGEGRLVSLRAAQLEMMKHGLTDPSFWAAFVLHGEPD